MDLYIPQMNAFNSTEIGTLLSDFLIPSDICYTTSTSYKVHLDVKLNNFRKKKRYSKSVCFIQLIKLFFMAD